MTIDEFNGCLGTEYKDFESVNWDYISKYKRLPEDFIREFADMVNWDYISKYQCLSEDFIREFADRVDWEWVSTIQHLSEDFIREFADRVYFTISSCQRLSEDFIRELADMVSWWRISKYQCLSEDFIREFADQVHWGNISAYQHLSEDFIREFADRLDTDKVKDNWIYRDVDFKKQQVVATDMYECYEDYFIAYKGIRSDRYSKFSFRYRYEKGGVYESWCDCSSDENSFGFSAWTEDDAREYCDELVVRVKVRYEDVGRVVYDGGKIRCFRIEVLD